MSRFAFSSEPLQVAAGKYTVWALPDLAEERDLSLFSHVDPEILAEHSPGGKSAGGVTVFAVTGGDGVVLVDAGNGFAGGERRSLLMDNMQKVGIHPDDVALILLTHLHGDHVGGLAWEGRPAFPDAAVKASRTELAFWRDSELVAQVPALCAVAETARKALALYPGRVSVFDAGEEVAPGITALEGAGHTPGHTCYLLESEDKGVLFWGDLAHSAALQFPRPDICSVYDMDPKAAALARRGCMSRVVRARLLIGGAHLPPPGLGRVLQESEGSFAYQPFIE